MFTWNLPALIRNPVLFTLLCIYLDWNLLAWFFITFIVFAELDEELTKYESYSDYYKAQLQLYDFSSVKTSDGWNLEEQMRVFNETNPEVVQNYQKTFKHRLQEMRIKNPQSYKPQTKAAKAAHKKEQVRLKQEIFGYEENHWDEERTYIHNAFTDAINYIGATSMYEWYHLNGLNVPEDESGIKTMCLYHDKYADALENQEYDKIIQSSVSELYKKQANLYNENYNPNFQSLPKSLTRIQNSELEQVKSFLYWPMSGYQKAKFKMPRVSHKNKNQYTDSSIGVLENMKNILDQPYLTSSIKAKRTKKGRRINRNQDQPEVINDSQFKTSVIKELEIQLNQYEPPLSYRKRRLMRINQKLSAIKQQHQTITNQMKI